MSKFIIEITEETTTAGGLRIIKMLEAAFHYAKEEAPAAEETEAEEKPKKKPAKTTKPAKVEDTEEDEKTAKAGSKAATAAEFTEDEAPKITLNQLRQLTADLAEDHRPEIKAQLTKLGANNVSTLPEDKYEAYFEFLEGLK